MLSRLSIGTQTHKYAGCGQVPVDVLSRSSIGTQTHDYAGCGWGNTYLLRGLKHIIMQVVVRKWQGERLSIGTETYDYVRDRLTY